MNEPQSTPVAESAFDSLPGGSFIEQLAPSGFRARRRESEPSPEREDMDARVTAAGGYWEAVTMESGGIAAGRPIARTQTEFLYFIPEAAFA
jgi:hypothetical protein